MATSQEPKRNPDLRVQGTPRGVLAPDGRELLQPKNRGGILPADLTAARLRLRHHRGELPLHNDRKSLNAPVNA